MDQGQSPGVWASAGIVLRLAAGWMSVLVGVLNVLVELDRSGGAPDTAYYLFHVVLLLGGIVLLGAGRLGGRPRVGTGTAGAAAVVAALAISSVPVHHAMCCMTGYAVRHGYPFTFLARDGEVGWHSDPQRLLADLVFWGYLGLVVLVMAGWAKRIVGPRRAKRVTGPRWAKRVTGPRWAKRVTGPRPDRTADGGEPPAKTYAHAEPRPHDEAREQQPADG